MFMNKLNTTKRNSSKAVGKAGRQNNNKKEKEEGRKER